MSRRAPCPTRLYPLFRGALLVACMCLAGPASGSATDTLQDLMSRYWNEQLRLHPQLALAQGSEDAQATFDDSLEDGWLADMQASLEVDAKAIGAIDPQHLSTSDRVSYRMLDYQIRQAREFYSGDLYAMARRLPIDQFQGPHNTYAADAGGVGAFPFQTVADYERALLRADRYARWTDQVIARLREGARTGVVLPSLVVERVLPQLAVHCATDAEHSEFWHPVESMPADFRATDRARLTLAYHEKIRDVIQPAYRRLQEYLSTEYLPQARATTGLGQMPGGAALYRHYVALHTTTTLSPAEIHALGLREVGRISAEMSRVSRLLGYHGDLRRFFAAVRRDSHQRFESPADVLLAYEDARVRIEPALASIFAHLPAARFEVRALPDSAKASQGNGYYAPPAADGSRPGILWMNVFAPGVRDRFNVMTISLHEGLPGHHLQTALAQERLALPAFRRFDESTAFVEGWGLYAESLGRDMKLYGDAWQYYGYLNYAMLRANRLVVDTGIHAQGWDVARAVRWMTDHSSMTAEQATAEVERYVADPGQALAYKIGELTIRSLRQRAEGKLGNRFDIRAFHDAVLLEGSLPLAILDENVQRWIDAVAATPGP